MGEKAYGIPKEGEAKKTGEIGREKQHMCGWSLGKCLIRKKL